VKIKVVVKNISDAPLRFGMLVCKPNANVESKRRFLGTLVTVFQKPEYLMEFEGAMVQFPNETQTLEWDWPFTSHKPTEMRFHPVPENRGRFLIESFTYGENQPILDKPGFF
jgi:hypothetical protein